MNYAELMLNMVAQWLMAHQSDHGRIQQVRHALVKLHDLLGTVLAAVPESGGTIPG